MTKPSRILVIGSSNTDMTVKSGHLPVPGETVMGGKFIMGPGGKGANQAVAARRLGADVTFICKVGRDLFGDNAIEGYRKEGIDVSHIMRSGEASGTALILVDGKGDNVISVAPGANADFTVADIDSVGDVIRSSDFLILQLEIPSDCVARAARIGHEAGVTVILNPAPMCPLPGEIFRDISLIIPNQTEISKLTGIEVTDGDSLAEAVRRIRESGVRDVIVTLGSKGALVAEGDTFVLVPALKVEAVDTTAAGDTFCGAICVGLSEGMTLVEAARFATRAAALTVQKIGAQSALPYRNEII